MTTYYVFNKDTKIFEGKITSDTPIPNSSEFEPMLTPVKGMKIVHDGTGWVQVPDANQMNLQNAKSYLMQILNRYSIDSKYTDYEIQTFSSQLNEANSYLNDSNYKSIILEKLAEINNIQIMDIANKIIEKDKENRISIVSILPTIQKYRKLIETANTIKELPTDQELESAIKTIYSLQS